MVALRATQVEGTVRPETSLFVHTMVAQLLLRSCPSGGVH